MATNKNQHFVPRCHLRPFTLDAQGLAISLINLDRKRLITLAPVKNQCSGDYFYGTDENLERVIQQIESQYACALSDLERNNRELSESHKSIFRTFWLFQYFRTEAAARRSVQMAEKTRNLASLPPEELRLGIKEAVQVGCRSFVSAMHSIDDLKFCLVKNRTNVPFITSDNPAVLTNKWRLDKALSPGQSFGIGTAGLLAILPLTPKLLFIGYDGDVYNIPHKCGVVEIKNAKDAIALNRHQFLQCVANIYLHDSSYSDALIQHYSDIESARPKERFITHYAQVDHVLNGHARYAVVSPEERDSTKDAIVHHQAIHPHPKVWPSQIKIRRNGAVYTNGSPMGYIRHSEMGTFSTGSFRRERP